MYRNRTSLAFMQLAKRIKPGLAPGVTPTNWDDQQAQTFITESEDAHACG